MNGKVIAISGPPGAGKSALSRLLSDAMSAKLVPYDAFEKMTRQPLPEMLDWLERAAPYNEIQTPSLLSTLQDAQTSGAVVFDTPLGRAHPETGKIIDFAVWIDCPLDVALSRKIAQMTKQVGEQQSASFVKWLNGYLELYSKIVRPACIIQSGRVVGGCDLRLDGTKPIADIFNTLMLELELNQQAE